MLMKDYQTGETRGEFTCLLFAHIRKLHQNQRCEITAQNAERHGYHMKKTNENENNIMETIEKLKDMIMEHRKIVLPVILVAALLITMGIGMAANRKNERQEEVQTSAAGEQEDTAAKQGLTVPDVLLEENAYPEVNELIMKYYKALEEKTTDDVLPEIMSPVTDNTLIYLGEWAKHVVACHSVNIYTKPGPREDSYLAYVGVELQIAGYDEPFPGMNSFFICKNEAGNYYINMEDEIDKEEADYIKVVNMQDDVKDLSNKYTVDYNQMTAPGTEAGDAVLDVDASITKGIQEKLLAKQETEQPQEDEQQPAEEQEETQPETVVTEVKTTAVVNMRSSDSEKADKLGKAQIGDTFKVLEQRPNGWTKLTDGTQEFFIKTEYLEATAEAPAGGETASAQTEEVQEQPTAVNELPGSNGYVTAKTTVNVRKSANEAGEKLGVIYQGERLELIMNQADGWSKVKYKGQTAYVKSEFME